MNRKVPIGVSLFAVLLLVLGSLSNVVGYQTFETSQQNIIKERINQREILFQTIADIINNKEIQRIILRSQINRGIFSVSDIPVITKNQLKQMYFIGLRLSKFNSKSKMQSLLEQNRFTSQEIQQQITAVIKKDATLNKDVTQLLNSECDCDHEQTSTWGFPILCSILNVLMIPPLILFGFGSFLAALALWFRMIGLIGSVMVMMAVPIVYAIVTVGTLFDCDWWFINT